jgi:hypothetical protein
MDTYTTKSTVVNILVNWILVLIISIISIILMHGHVLTLIGFVISVIGLVYHMNIVVTSYNQVDQILQKTKVKLVYLQLLQGKTAKNGVERGYVTRIKQIKPDFAN